MTTVAPQQASIDAMARHLWDVLIIGAGPAGTTAAVHLARNGHSVLLLDRCCFPRDKVCGDILIPDALQALARMGLRTEVCHLGRPLDHAAIFSPARIEVRIPGDYVTLQRLHLDALLARTAVDAGAVLCHGNAEQVGVAQGQVSCRCTSGAEVHARVGLIATGANVRLLDDLPISRGGLGGAVAARFYVRSSFPLDRLVFAYDRSTLPGYAWIAPLRGRIFNIGCGIAADTSRRRRPNLRSMLNRFINSFPLAKLLLEQGEALSPLRGARLRCGLRPYIRAGSEIVLGIGETIDATFPFTGEGIGKAMETAERAASAVDIALRTGDLSRLGQFPASLERALRSKYLAYDQAQRWLSRPWLNNLVMSRVRGSRFLRQEFAGIVDETVDPRTIFSLAGVMKSLWY